MSGDANWVCDPAIEDCATDAIIANDYHPITSYTILGVTVYSAVILPFGFYWLRLFNRSSDTGVFAPTNAIDLVALSHWIISLAIFLFPMIMYPYYFILDSYMANYINAWYYAYIIADFWFVYNVVRFFLNLFIAIYAGRGNE